MSRQRDPLADLVDRARGGDESAFAELKRALGLDDTDDVSATSTTRDERLASLIELAQAGDTEAALDAALLSGSTEPDVHDREGAQP